MKKLFRNLLRSLWFQRAVGFLAAEFLRLVWLTNRFSFDPPDVYEIVEPRMPANAVTAPANPSAGTRTSAGCAA